MSWTAGSCSGLGRPAPGRWSLHAMRTTAISWGEVIHAALNGGLAPLVDARLRGVVGEDGRELVRFAAERIRIRSRCRKWRRRTACRRRRWSGAASAGACRRRAACSCGCVLYGLRWLLEPGPAWSRSRTSSATSGAAFRRRSRRRSVGVRARSGVNRVWTARSICSSASARRWRVPATHCDGVGFYGTLRSDRAASHADARKGLPCVVSAR